MIKDRLAELKACDSVSTDSVSNSIDEEDYELIPTSSQEFSVFVREILPELDEIQKTLEEWNDRQKAMIERKTIFKTEKEELEEKSRFVRKKMRLLKPRIDEMNRKFGELKRNSSKEIELKIVENQYVFVRKVLKDSFELKTFLEIEFKNKVANWFDDELMTPSHHEISHEPYFVELEKPVVEVVEVVDETELRALLETKPLSRAKSINKALREIKKRNDEIFEVEEKVRLLHEMMEDLEHVVHTQGEMGIRVEGHTEVTKIIMDKVEIQTGKAILTRNSANDKLCAIFAIVLCFFLIFLILNLSRIVF